MEFVQHLPNLAKRVAVSSVLDVLAGVSYIALMQAQ